MVTVGLLVTMQAKPGKEDELAEFLASALPLAQAEPETTAWFAIKIDASTLGIVDVFPHAAGRQAHLDGPIAAALMQRVRGGEVRPLPPRTPTGDSESAWPRFAAGQDSGLAGEGAGETR